MRIVAASLFAMAAIPSAWAADRPYAYPAVVEEVDEPVVVRPARRVIVKRTICVRCSHLPLGGLREPVVAQVPLGGLRKACPPVWTETVRERVVLRVKG